MLERLEERLVERLRLLVARRGVAALLLEARALVVGSLSSVNALAISIPAGERLPPLGQPGSERWRLASGEISTG